jgi:hypothetical protein
MPVNLLILSNLDCRGIFRSGSLPVALKAGLNAHPSIHWRIHDPLAGLPDFGGVDVVLTWCHHIAANSRKVRNKAVEIENECAARGIPVVNSARKMRQIRHSYCLQTWFAQDIPCALSQSFRSIEEIVLRYPMILRVDGGAHSSLDSFLVRDRAEAERVVRERSQSRRAGLNLAIEFVDTRFPDGFFRKRRCIVVGDRILPRQHMLAHEWKVKLSSAETSALAVAEDRAFLAHGEERTDLVGRAAAALECDILAVDYSPAPDGSYIFWEANRTFRMAGTGTGVKSTTFRESTGRSVEECIAERAAVGSAIAELILARAENGIVTAATSPANTSISNPIAVGRERL